MPPQRKAASSRAKDLLGRMKDKVTAKFRGGTRSAESTTVARLRELQTGRYGGVKNPAAERLARLREINKV
jgi:hypothetical protein